MIRMFSQEREMEFGIVKCILPIIKSEKRERKEGKELTNPKGIRTMGEKENCKYLRILEVDTIKQAEMKEKGIKKEVPQKNKKKFS